jgi:hypothetical protein
MKKLPSAPVCAWIAFSVGVALACVACSDEDSPAAVALTAAQEPPRPQFKLTPTVLRLDESSNEIIWEMEEGKVYTLWVRSHADAPVSKEPIENVASPYVHQVDGEQAPYYYALSDADTRPGPEGFTAYFSPRPAPRYGLLALADINGDGCVDILGLLGDCRGGFTGYSDAELGLESLLAGGRNYRDGRLADFNGDGRLDVVSNSYNPFLPGAPPAQLHFGVDGGRFAVDPEFAELGAAGYGETILVADFDNDSDLDIFIPYYSYESADEKSWLLLNDGTGKFTDVADEMGVALRNIPVHLRPEGAQAIDLDFDGDIDFAVASKLFINQLVETGSLEFVEQSFPRGFDEGLKFIDWNNDGVFDVVTQYPYSDIGPQLFEANGLEFTQRMDSFPLSRHHFAYGLNCYDVNGDGRIDVMSSGGRNMGDSLPHHPQLFINTPAGFRKQQYADTQYFEGNDIMAFADFDRSGTIDFVARMATNEVFMNTARTTNHLRIRLLGANGEENQFGRVVRIRSDVDSSVVMAHAVDGGSGYLANNQYQMLVNLPLAGTYTIEAYFPTGVVRVEGVSARNIVDIYENGRTRVTPRIPAELVASLPLRLSR